MNYYVLFLEVLLQVWFLKSHVWSINAKVGCYKSDVPSFPSLDSLGLHPDEDRITPSPTVSVH